MNSTIVVTLFALTACSCVPVPGANLVGPQTARMSALRTRDGACAAAPVMGHSTGISTCLIIGMPNTLYDNTEPRYQTTITGPANSPISDVNNWQVESWRDDRPVAKLMLERAGTTELDCSVERCQSWSMSTMHWSTNWAPGTYVFRYTFALDTSVVAINMITLQGAP